MRDMGWSMAQGGRVEFREMDGGVDISRVIEGYAAAAHRAREAGLDGVELHVPHGYLIDQFLSPTSNFRTDDYGGPAVNRARFLVEVLDAIRGRSRARLPRCAAHQRHRVLHRGRAPGRRPGGRRSPANRRVGTLSSERGDAPTRPSAPTPRPTPPTPRVDSVRLAAAVKARVGIPVIAVGRIGPAGADRLIVDEPPTSSPWVASYWPTLTCLNKLAAGQADDIRPCMYDYRCISQIFVGQSVRCAANPDTVVEIELGRAVPVSRRRVLVGPVEGPAGMEAAACRPQRPLCRPGRQRRRARRPSEPGRHSQERPPTPRRAACLAAPSGQKGAYRAPARSPDLRRAR